MKNKQNIKNNKSEIKAVGKKCSMTNYYWVIAILAVLLILALAFIFSEKVCCGQKLFDYISYASVILSITLSIFAIQYTYVSNIEVQHQFEKIDDAAKEIVFTSEKLESSIENIISKLDRLDEGQQTLNRNFIHNSQLPPSTP